MTAVFSDLMYAFDKELLAPTELVALGGRETLLDILFSEITVVFAFSGRIVCLKH